IPPRGHGSRQNISNSVSQYQCEAMVKGLIQTYYPPFPVGASQNKFGPGSGSVAGRVQQGARTAMSRSDRSKFRETRGQGCPRSSGEIFERTLKEGRKEGAQN